MERIAKSNSSHIEWKRYIHGVAVYTVTTNTNGDVQGTQKAYLLKDHLGSTDIITDALGTVIESLSFDPWGERRNALDWESLDIASLLNFNANLLDTTTRGFTGHEMLDAVGIVHMNGRVYDARLGRFLQADPFIQAAGDTQMSNRYSYVGNNPHNSTEPTGYFKLRQWDGVTATVDGVSYEIRVNIAQQTGLLSWSSADLRVNDWSSAPSGCGTRGCQSASDIWVCPSGGRFIRNPRAPAHEFGHYLGLKHQHPSTNSIMNLSPGRSIQSGSDIQRYLQCLLAYVI